MEKTSRLLNIDKAYNLSSADNYDPLAIVIIASAIIIV
jgi:hypothetical protein